MDSENIEKPLLTSQEEQEEENFPSSQPHPPQDEQNQQYPLSQIPAQSHPQQQQQGYPQQQEMQPPPYSGSAHTTQPMPYSPYAQQPQVAQPTHVNRNTTVVVTGGAVAQPQCIYGFPAESYMALSILTCLFCFWPVSIAAIIKSSEVTSANAVGDYVRAGIASRSARRLNMISLGIGIGIIAAIVVLAFMSSALGK